MRSTSRELCWLALAFALGAGCGGNTEREASDPDATVVAYGGAAGVGGSAGAAARGGGVGSAGAAGSSGTSSGAAGVAGTTGGNSGSGNAGGDAGIGGTNSGAGGSAGEADAGVADTCSLLADTGPCFAAMPRFHYDPVTAGCREFIYGGCGGNLNNFMTRADCEAKCSHRANRCAMCLSDGCMDLYECSACPVNGDASGRVCTTLGFQCHFGGCGGPICTCRAGAAGLAWQCITLPC